MVNVLAAAAAVEERCAADVDLVFADVDGVERREPLSVCWGTRFERAPPVRAFASYCGQRNFPGLWWFATTGDHVGFESWLERDLIRTLRRVIVAGLVPAGADGTYRLINLAPASVRACRGTLEPHRSMNLPGGAVTGGVTIPGGGRIVDCLPESGAVRCCGPWRRRR
jgi:hypothetical protein